VKRGRGKKGALQVGQQIVQGEGIGDIGWVRDRWERGFIIAAAILVSIDCRLVNETGTSARSASSNLYSARFPSPYFSPKAGLMGCIPMAKSDPQKTVMLTRAP